MSTPKQITFTYREIAEMLARDAGVQKGLWGLYVRFGLAAANIGASSDDMKPAAIVPIIDRTSERRETSERGKGG